MELDELKQIIARLEASGLQSLELQRPDGRVRLVVGAGNQVQVISADQATEAPVAAFNVDVTVASETVGQYFAAHPMQDTPLAGVGCAVGQNDVVGLLKVGLLYSPVISPVGGVITEVLAEDGELLGFGSPVIRMRAA